jgi:hypothetical protein
MRACVRGKAEFFLVMTKNLTIQRAIAAIPDAAWTPAVAQRGPRSRSRALISDAEVAEVPYTAFAHTKAGLPPGWWCAMSQTSRRSGRSADHRMIPNGPTVSACDWFLPGSGSAHRAGVGGRVGRYEWWPPQTARPAAICANATSRRPCPSPPTSKPSGSSAGRTTAICGGSLDRLLPEPARMIAFEQGHPSRRARATRLGPVSSRKAEVIGGPR